MDVVETRKDVLHNVSQMLRKMITIGTHAYVSLMFFNTFKKKQNSLDSTFETIILQKHIMCLHFLVPSMYSNVFTPMFYTTVCTLFY